jgi:hypothetical protein
MPPQPPQLPAAQAPPNVGQVEPEPVQRLFTQQPPPLQVVAAQQTSPGPPQAEQMPSPLPVHTVDAVSRHCRPGQQACASPPQAEQTPFEQVPSEHVSPLQQTAPRIPQPAMSMPPSELPTAGLSCVQLHSPRSITIVATRTVCMRALPREANASGRARSTPARAGGYWIGSPSEKEAAPMRAAMSSRRSRL